MNAFAEVWDGPIRGGSGVTSAAGPFKIGVVRGCLGWGCALPRIRAARPGTLLTRPTRMGSPGRAQCVGVIVALHSAHAGEGVLGELTALLILPQRLQDEGEAVGRAQCVVVVIAPDPA